MNVHVTDYEILMKFVDVMKKNQLSIITKKKKQHNGRVQALKIFPYELLYDSSVLRASVIQIKPCFSLQKRTKCYSRTELCILHEQHTQIMTGQVSICFIKV